MSSPKREADVYPNTGELKTSNQSLTGGKKTIGRYEVIRVLGRGAFGTVKLAVDPRSGTQVRVM
jgi:serine/threonine protein kinase